LVVALAAVLDMITALGPERAVRGHLGKEIVEHQAFQQRVAVVVALALRAVLVFLIQRAEMVGLVFLQALVDHLYFMQAVGPVGLGMAAGRD
jgi:hypothetical protein